MGAPSSKAAAAADIGKVEHWVTAEGKSAVVYFDKEGGRVLRVVDAAGLEIKKFANKTAGDLERGFHWARQEASRAVDDIESDVGKVKAFLVKHLTSPASQEEHALVGKIADDINNIGKTSTGADLSSDSDKASNISASARPISGGLGKKPRTGKYVSPKAAVRMGPAMFIQLAGEWDGIGLPAQVAPMFQLPKSTWKGR